MRRISACLLLSLAALGCGGDDSSGPAGSVDISVRTLQFGTEAALADVTMDDTLHFTVRADTTITNVSSGVHRFTARTSIDYLPVSFRATVGPNSKIVAIPRPLTCAFFATAADVAGCDGRNAFYWGGHTLVACPANDYGDVCSAGPDVPVGTLGEKLGLTWPDSGSSAINTYIYHGKLLVGALRQKSAGAGDDTLAMAFYQAGDYAPRRRLAPVGTDSTRWQTEVWTDVRHIPYLGSDTARLRSTDRPGQNFGLSVTTTAYLPPTQPNAILLRFDVKNISTEPDFRFAHPEEPAAGHTLRDIYLAPFFDPDIGGGRTQNGANGLIRTQDIEATDDNVTVFPDDALIAAYDQAFAVTTFSASFRDRPGLAGIQFLDGPSGTTARAVLAGPGIVFDFVPAAREDTLYAIYSAGRAGGQLLPAACSVGLIALVCSTEAAANVRAGWSIGPISSLAPGQSVSITVAILVAPPKVGAYTSGAAIPPQNSAITSTSRTIYNVAEPLRTLAAQLRSLRVVP
ncbi:MAG: hypothetical protein WKG32_17075 [Gemmatimonadaceae bacterium]